MLLFLSASFLYAILRSIRRGPANILFSLGLTIAAVFLVPGIPATGVGPYIAPAVGAFRFFWCYALLGVLVYGLRSDPGGTPRRDVLIAGCVTWLAGTLWSVESAVYCAAIWLPAYAFFIVRRAIASGPGGESSSAGRAGGIVRWLALPPALVLAAVGGITAYYRMALGHAPDWGAYLEPVRAAKVMALPMNPGGCVLALLLVFCALSGVAVLVLRRGGPPGSLALIAGAWAAVWATASYFVGRSHEVNATNLSPILCTAVAAALHLLARHRMTDRAALLVRASLVPVLTVLLTTAFGARDRLPDCLATLKRGYVRDIDRRLPAMPPSLVELLAAANVGRDDPVVYVDGLDHIPARPRGAGAGRRPPSAQRTWLPVNCFAVYRPLPEDRRRVYLARFVARARAGGWLIQRNTAGDPRFSWFFDELSKTHTATDVLENPDWRLTRYELRDRPTRETGPTRLGRR